MLKIYANLNSDSICEAIIEYQTPLDNPPSSYKEIDTHDATLIGKKWNGSSWEEVS